MVWELEYPLFLLPFDAGYVSVVETESAESQTYYLAIFTSEQAAAEFSNESGIESEPRPLRNPRELAWLLQSLRTPVESVAFDPAAGSTAVESPWKVKVSDLLAHHVLIDYSPWNYPVFVIEQASGYACIEGASSKGTDMRAVGLFTQREKAQEYLAASSGRGRIVALDDLRQTRDFLEDLLPDATAVAIDPVISADHQSAEYCFSIRTVLDKYLVRGGRRK